MAATNQEYSNPPPLHWPIEVPETPSAGESLDVIEFANFLLTKLLQRDKSVLHGAFKDDVGRWLVRPFPDGEEVEIGQHESIGMFRMILARFGYWYMAVQLYGGTAQRPLIHKGRRYDCDFTMSNDNRVGYYLTVHAKLHAT